MLGRELSEPYSLYIESSDLPPFFSQAEVGVLITHFPWVSYHQFYPANDLGNRYSVRDAAVRAYRKYEWRKRMGTYQLCLANSNFTRGWIHTYWNRDSTVLYPPLRPNLNAQEKLPVILNIGAFRAGGHKRQDILISAFRRLCDSGLSEWELTLVGSSGPDEADTWHLEKLRASAEGYPIRFVTDASGAEVEDMLQTSSVLWHAMGYGVDKERNPGLLEHFGMVVSEAMAASTIPLVYNGGGLPEIVNEAVNGFCWNTVEELTSKTIEVLEDACLREKLAASAKMRSENFSEVNFERRLLALLGPFLRG